MLELSAEIADVAFKQAVQTREWFDTDLGPETYAEVGGKGYTVWLDSRNRFALVYEYGEENGTPARAKASPTQHRAVALAATTALGNWARTAGAQQAQVGRPSSS
ncbi:hypothetical protein [Streptomyces sp. 1222.5]|uniref:hypothetical protein n=1 Tax=Streptomyces sp. 1222.5 TaxID=1881026 RepID=UPI003EBB1372